MARRRSNRVTPLIALVMGAAACDAPPDPTGPAAREGDDVEARQTGRWAQSLRRHTLASQVEGFGGVYVDGSGVLSLVLTDDGDADAAESALLRMARGSEAGAVRGVDVRPGDYRYTDLDAWQEAIRARVFASPGVVLTHVDEARNRIVVGVESPGDVPAAQTAAAGLGIPTGAIIYETGKPIYPMHTLRDEAPELQGGYQINYPGFLCTLGFPARSGNEASFITNSHCTNRQGGVESTPYFQPLSSVNATQIGVEVDDPHYFTGGSCPAGYRCRFSDAARVLQRSGRPFAQGRIAAVAGQGSLEVVGSHTIAGKSTDCPVQGSTVDKVGRTTGLTRGPIQATCVAVVVAGTDILLFSQVLVQAGVGPGDSGSPVYTGPSAGVRLEGVLWGGSTDGTLYAYSPMGAVEHELGVLDVTASDPAPSGCASSSPQAAIRTDGDGRVVLVWNDCYANDTNFRVQRFTIENGARVASWARTLPPSPGTGGMVTFEDDGVEVGGTYEYRMRVKVGSQWLPWSPVQEVTVSGDPGGCRPDASPVPSLQPVSRPAVVLSFQDCFEHDGGFRIRRFTMVGGQMTDPRSWTLDASPGVGQVVRWHDEQVESGAEYAYRIRVHDGEDWLPFGRFGHVTVP